MIIAGTPCLPNAWRRSSYRLCSTARRSRSASRSSRCRCEILQRGKLLACPADPLVGQPLLQTQPVEILLASARRLAAAARWPPPAAPVFTAGLVCGEPSRQRAILACRLPPAVRPHRRGSGRVQLSGALLQRRALRAARAFSPAISRSSSSACASISRTLSLVRAVRLSPPVDLGRSSTRAVPRWSSVSGWPQVGQAGSGAPSRTAAAGLERLGLRPEQPGLRRAAAAASLAGRRPRRSLSPTGLHRLRPASAAGDISASAASRPPAVGARSACPRPVRSRPRPAPSAPAMIRRVQIVDLPLQAHQLAARLLRSSAHCARPPPACSARLGLRASAAFSSAWYAPALGRARARSPPAGPPGGGCRPAFAQAFLGALLVHLPARQAEDGRQDLLALRRRLVGELVGPPLHQEGRIDERVVVQMQQRRRSCSVRLRMDDSVRLRQAP